MIRVVDADLADETLVEFLSAHLADMAPTAPAASRHALDVAALRAPGVRMWVAQAPDDELLGTVALVPIDGGHDELKSMRTAPAARERGVGRALALHALDDARARGLTRVSLETGSMAFFAPARALYRAVGFVECDPFGTYRHDPNSVFMTVELSHV
ncbi:GNAT family N-acetyltransferase [Tsukamurella sp. 8F]|uniref:GNAT family N-acetyltransferase n=1 Tax=unclassified Tsukamurella TaxID=2633480 RepID=UPI0023B90D56|nr:MULTISPECIES: GNAT family N-acetyltransferase [unclassified Tsukamurella]MDF0528705.1 GNAT family N-acetyltransferase [Tsukamurella sp. 8J]MDF0585667.1 GNAT family N-acetyltransferase [Tsukamurella sp. 8F]